jgi:hypothetical protein
MLFFNAIERLFQKYLNIGSWHRVEMTVIRLNFSQFCFVPLWNLHSFLTHVWSELSLGHFELLSANCSSIDIAVSIPSFSSTNA